MTPDEIENDRIRRAALSLEIDRLKAEVREIDDRATALRVHRMALLMAKHAAQEEREERARTAVATRAARRRRAAENPVPFNERAERDSGEAVSA